jgi:hypothetical protein
MRHPSLGIEGKLVVEAICMAGTVLVILAQITLVAVALDSFHNF